DPLDAHAGLRERKKLATREAIGAAALRLALERGLDRVRVSDIAAAAGVSPRTYNNYFSSREEAICAAGTERTRRLVDALRGRPASEPLAKALTHAMSYRLEHAEPDRAMFQVIFSDPGLRAEFLKGTFAMQRALAVAIAERVGADPERDLMPRVVAAAYEGAARAAVSHWLRQEDGPPLREVMREALTALSPIATRLEWQMRNRRRGRSAGGDAATGDDDGTTRPTRRARLGR
ncbi:MAG TPA: TetR family transcriptional regulator, partial [Acidimicrobiales bacterium]|nr:TetR family transcriptional regulator [Acidimicrobiales bacterium]